MKRKIRDKLRRKKADLNKPEINENVPRITNETVAAHREEVLSSARKYIYPLQHSKHRIVLISTGLFIVSIIGFFAYCTLALYRFNNSSTFIYRVTQVVPFPVARTEGRFISYENYLFELRRYRHYYESQQKIDFTTEKDKPQLETFKKQALDKVVNDAYVKVLAAKYKVSISDKEINDQVTTVRAQNRLGGSDKVFEDVLKDYWGWSVDDFKRSLREQLLAQKLVAILDTEAQAKAAAALAELNAGADFSAMAKKYSDDVASKDTGGEYGFMVDRTSRDVTALATDALFKLQPGQFSGVINTGYRLEILKAIEVNGDKIRGAHIAINFKDISVYLNDIKDKQKAKTYIKL